MPGSKKKTGSAPSIAISEDGDTFYFVTTRDGPAVPDIDVDNAPVYRTAEDAQLKRAVEELLSQIEE